VVARRLAEGLLKASKSGQTVRDLLAKMPETGGGATVPVASSPVVGTPVVSSESGVGASNGASAVASIAAPAPTPAVAPHAPLPAQPAANGATATPAPAAEPASDAIAIEPYIESERCTTCNECTNLNKKMFAYNANKQAYIKDPKAGTFAQLVQAAEKCPVSAIHPGTPVNPKEKDLEKWLKRAQAF
jgi:pyruvate-ferredoxin/flavodoxin oxidoreductase